MAHMNIGIIRRKRQEFDRAVTSYNKALAELTKVEDKKGILTVHRNIGTIHHLKGDLKRAKKHFNKSLDIAKEILYETGITKAQDKLDAIENEIRTNKGE